jgi:hypothetical protein
MSADAIKPVPLIKEIIKSISDFFIFYAHSVQHIFYLMYLKIKAREIMFPYSSLNKVIILCLYFYNSVSCRSSKHNKLI